MGCGCWVGVVRLVDWWWMVVGCWLDGIWLLGLWIGGWCWWFLVGGLVFGWWFLVGGRMVYGC